VSIWTIESSNREGCRVSGEKQIVLCIIELEQLANPTGDLVQIPWINPRALCSFFGANTMVKKNVVRLWPCDSTHAFHIQPIPSISLHSPQHSFAQLSPISQKAAMSNSSRAGRWSSNVVNKPMFGTQFLGPAMKRQKMSPATDSQQQPVANNKPDTPLQSIVNEPRSAHNQITE
jgi:hypothetical protein